LHHQGHATLTYRHQGELQRTEHETFEEDQPNSHDENTCLTCQARREEPMHDVEDNFVPRHSDYEDDFAAAGLGQPSHNDDDYIDTYETTCIGIRDIILTGEVRSIFLHRSPVDTDPCCEDGSQSRHGLGSLYVSWPRAPVGWPDRPRASPGACLVP
jgi:hypothetical protein